MDSSQKKKELYIFEKVEKNGWTVDIFYFNRNAALVEAAAVKLCIQVAIDTGLTPLIIETDCKDVVNLVLHKKSNQTEICWIITNIQSEMQRRGKLFKISIFQERTM